jgi:predicted MFS family arabinose efflux permease
MVSPKISSRVGTVNTIILAVSLSIPFYIGMAFAPTLSILSLLYFMRRAIANLAAPLTSSLMMKVLPDEEKATASGINMTTQKLSSALATWIGAILISNYSINTPIYLGVLLYTGYIAVIYFLFNSLDAKLVPLQVEALVYD